jgi:hypothetical protein
LVVQLSIIVQLRLQVGCKFGKTNMIEPGCAPLTFIAR